jgi:hypothetical protein
MNIYAQIVGVCWDMLYVYDLSPKYSNVISVPRAVVSS